MSHPPPETGTNAWTYVPEYDPESGEYCTFSNNQNRLEIGRNSSAAITGMRVIITNQFAPIPISGHTFSSAQFIGKGSTEVSMTLANIGDSFLSNTSSMVNVCEGNARGFNAIKDCSKIHFSNNELLKLAGIEGGYIVSFDTETSSESPDLYNAQLSFTSGIEKTETLRQEYFVNSDPIMELANLFLQGFFISTPVVEGAVVEEPSIPETSAPHSAEGGLPAPNAGEFDRFFERLGEQWLGSLGLEPATIGLNMELQIAEDWYRYGIGRVWEMRNEGRYLPKPILTPFANQPTEPRAVVITPQRLTSDQGIPAPEWFSTLVTRMAAVLNEGQNTLPPNTFFYGLHRGRYLDFTQASSATSRGDFHPQDRRIEIDSRMTESLSRLTYGQVTRHFRKESIEQNIRTYLVEVYTIIQELSTHQNDPIFRTLFPSLTGRLNQLSLESLHPAYPDLQLPPHPVSGEVIDTEPDYFWFNDSEEGMLNQIGPEVVRDIDDRLNNLQNSFNRLASGQTWQDTSLQRSLFGPDPNGPNALQETQGWTVSGELPSTMECRPEGGMTITPNSGDSARPVTGPPVENNSSVVDTVLSVSSAVIGQIGASNDALETTARNRRLEILRNSTYQLPAGSNTTGLQIGPIDEAVSPQDNTHSFSRNYIREIVLQSLLQNPNTMLTMRRAFPTFKIYFIEDDTGPIGRGRDHLLPTSNVVMFFDDLYHYNAVKDIRLIRSRKNPADLLIITVSNVAGILTKRRWDPNERAPREIHDPGIEDTNRENPLKKLIVKEGLKVQARLGHSNNPDFLGKKFIGEVVEVGHNSVSADEITIVCQGYGVELTLDHKGMNPETRTQFFDTADMLHTIICSPELVHFGRFDLNPEFNPAEARGQAASNGAWAAAREEFARTRNVSLWSAAWAGPNWIASDVLSNLREVMLKTRSKWILTNNPADDNIFAPSRNSYLSWVESTKLFLAEATQAGATGTGLSSNLIYYVGGLWWRDPIFGLPRFDPAALIAWANYGILRGGEAIFSALSSYINPAAYTASGTTVWDIFKEMELRHPGWIAQPRPYGTRATMFFGVPTHYYWADQITREEIQALREAERLFSGMAIQDNVGNWTGADLETGVMLAATGPANLIFYNHLRAIRRIVYRGAWVNFSMDMAGSIIAKTFGRFRPFRRYHLVTSDHHIITNNIRASEKGTYNAVEVQYSGGTYTLKADDDIPDEKMRLGSFSYPSCHDSNMARRYCAALLARHLKDVYKGELLLTGMDIDPHDIIFLYDTRSDMYGPIGVEQVVDTFTPQTGWVTEVTPDLCSHVNEWATTATSTALIGVLKDLAQRSSYSDIIVGGGLTIAAASAAPEVVAVGAFLAGIGGYHIVRWTQERQPIWVTPLIHHNFPFISGLDGMRMDGLFASLRGQLIEAASDITDGWRALHLAAYGNDTLIGIAQWAGGQSGE